MSKRIQTPSQAVVCDFAKDDHSAPHMQLATWMLTQRKHASPVRPHEICQHHGEGKSGVLNDLAKLNGVDNHDALVPRVSHVTAMIRSGDCSSYQYHSSTVQVGSLAPKHPKVARCMSNFHPTVAHDDYI